MTLLVMEPDAVRDTFAAQDWYEAERQGLGTAFAGHLTRTIDAILRHPLAHRPVRNEARWALLKRFPYGVLYIVRGDTVHVIGVIHTARDPKMVSRRARKFGS